MPSHPERVRASYLCDAGCGANLGGFAVAVGARGRYCSAKCCAAAEATEPLHGIPASIGVDEPLTHRVGGYMGINRNMPESHLWPRIVKEWRVQADEEVGCYWLVDDRDAKLPLAWHRASGACQPSAPKQGSPVRAWFRQMRAAEFERSIPVAFGVVTPPMWKGLSGEKSERWTLFDTQAVVERECGWTAFTPGTYGSIRRSDYPCWSSKVETSARAFTLDDMRKAPW